LQRHTCGCWQFKDKKFSKILLLI